MKGRGFYLLSVLLLHMIFIGLVAAEGESKEIPTPNTSNHAVDISDTKNGPPSFVKGDGEKKDDDAQQKTTSNALKDAEKNQNEGKDKPLEKPKASGDLSKESLDEASNKKKPHSVDSQAAECDPSNMCIDKKTELVACLRVPGTDSQALSLVIQNKGKGSLDVKIAAPSFVNLELASMQVKPKEDKEVKVYVNEGNAKDLLITVQAGGDNCSLDLKNIIPNSISRSEALAMPRFISTSTGVALLFIFLVAALIMAAAWLLCTRFRPFLRRESSPKYQKVEVGLPVSSGGKKEADNGDDNWDNSWGNGWDEEEAPMTPSKAISSPSLKGLASRRFNKDGWKD